MAQHIYIEPGQGRKAAAIDVPVSRVPLLFYENTRRIYGQLNQAYAHAEMIAIQKAAEVKGNWCLNDCDLYVTLEPCMMCTGIINLSRIRSVYYGTTDPKGGCLETVIDLKKINRLNHYPNIVGSILQKECAEILTNYFRKKREITKEKKQKNKANIQ